MLLGEAWDRVNFRMNYPGVKASSYPVDDTCYRNLRKPCERGDTFRIQSLQDGSHGGSGQVYLFPLPPSGNLHGTPARPPLERPASASFLCGSLNSPYPCSCVCLQGKNPRQPKLDRRAKRRKPTKTIRRPQCRSKRLVSCKPQCYRKTAMTSLAGTLEKARSGVIAVCHFQK